MIQMMYYKLQTFTLHLKLNLATPGMKHAVLTQTPTYEMESLIRLL